MAGDVRVLGDLARSASLQRIPSPSIWYSALVAGPPFFEDRRARLSTRGARAGALPWSRAATPGTDWRLMVAEARGSGAQRIKLYAALSADVLQPITEEAHRQGLRVWSHAALFPARPRDIVAAGVDVLSHAALLVWDAEERLPDYTQRASADYSRAPATELDNVLKDMAARGTLLEPTLHVSFAQAAQAGRWSAEITRRAHRLGVQLVAGTDGLGPGAAGELPTLHRELELLVTEAGLTPLEAIVAATRNAARALGIDESFGTAAVGKSADFVVLNADPTASVSHTREIACVIRGGRVYATKAPAEKGCGVEPS
jgi:imidazolonepropionase-like amidohydrolase